MKVSEAAPAAMFLHCSAVYEKMLSRSSRVQADGQTQMIVYEGMLTRLVVEELGLPVPYYTKIRTSLISMGCIRQLKRGGGTSPSQWEIITEPNITLWEQIETTDKQNNSDGPPELIQVIRALDRRLLRLEKVMGLEDVPLVKEA